LLVVIVLNRISFNNMRTYSELVDHTREVITTFESISNDFKSAQIYSPKLNQATESRFNLQYKINADQISHQLSRLRTLVRENKEQLLRADSLASLINSQSNTLLSKDISELILSGDNQRLGN